MNRFERVALSVLLVGAACSGAYCALQPRPRAELTNSPGAVYELKPVGILRIAPGDVVALVTAESDTIFTQGVDSTAVAFWDGRRFAGAVPVTLLPGAELPSPDAAPVFCTHEGEVCVVFVQRDGGVLAAGIVHKVKQRA